MAHHYAAFVIHHLHRTRDDRRITIVYTRTGETCTVTGVEAATAWLSAHSLAWWNQDTNNAAWVDAAPAPDDGVTHSGEVDIVAPVVRGRGTQPAGVIIARHPGRHPNGSSTLLATDKGWP